MAASADLFAQKLKVIMQRVETKDYRDVAALLRSGLRLVDGLAAAIALFGEQFSAQECARALVYFGAPGLKELPLGDRTTISHAVQTLPGRPIRPSLLKSKRLGFESQMD